MGKFCQYCNVNRLNYSVHIRSRKHQNLVKLHELLNELTDVYEKRNIAQLILDVRNNEARDTHYRQNRLKIEDFQLRKQDKTYPSIYGKSNEGIILKKVKEITRSDGTIEINETWYDPNDRFNRKKKS